MIRGLLGLVAITSASGCLFLDDLKHGEAPRPDAELALPELLRPRTQVVWAIDWVGPNWDPRLIELAAVFGATGSSVLVDPYPSDYLAAKSIDVHNAILGVRESGELSVTPLFQVGLRTNVGEEFIAGASTTSVSFSLWCTAESAFLVRAEPFPVPGSVWCKQPARMAVGSSAATAVLISLTAGGPVYDIDLSTNATQILTPSALRLPPGVDFGAIRFVDRPTPGELAVVTETGGVWAYQTTSGAPRMAGAALTGEAAGSEPVRRELDGTLTVMTTTGLFSWVVDGAVTTIVASPPPTIDAPWVSASGYGGAIARQTRPSDLDLALTIPVAVQARIWDGTQFVVHDVPTTPCITTEACREVGESRVVGLVGMHVVYELWSWYLTSGHELKGLYSVPLE